MAMSLNEVISSLWSNMKTYLGNNYLSKTGKAASSTVADKATSDASGNNIVNTYATKLYVDNEISGIVNSAPETLDTLNELASALGDDPNFATTIATQIGTKADNASVVHTTGDETVAGTKTFSSQINGNISGSSTSCTGNSVSATKLATGRTINIQDADGTNTGTAVTFNGTTNGVIKLPATIKATITGNASTATQFSANKSVTLTGDVTGTASSNAGWSVATTLANSGATAGTYGPTADVTGNNNATIVVPQITVDAKGRVTAVTTKTLTCKNNTYTVNDATLTIQKNGTTVKTFTANASSNVTANITVPTKVSELTNDSGYITGVSWDNVSGKPSTFTPKAHTHDYLPLSGGYLTGHFVGRNVDNSLLHLSSCTDYIKGAMLVMYGEGSSDLPGCFRLIARNSSTIYELYGNPKGELSWSGKHIVRSVNGVTADSSGNVSITYVSNATKATQDASGNVINTTYATKTDLSGKANDNDVVHKSGDETINGVKFFNNLVYLHNNMSNKNSQMDLFTTPTSMLCSHYMFVDKNNEVSAYMQYAQQNTGTDFIGLFIHDKSRNLHGIQLTTNNEVIPLGNNAYSLGSTNNKWLDCYATNFYGDSGSFSSITTSAPNFLRNIYGDYGTFWYQDNSGLYLLVTASGDQNGGFTSARPLSVNLSTGVCTINGNANSATYATTQAASDNSTKIATTAFVKSQGYVSLTSLAGGTTSGTMASTVGTMLFAFIGKPTTDYANVTGSQVYAAIITTSSGGDVVCIRSDTAINVGTWRVLGVNAGYYNSNYCMVIRVA